MDLNTFFFGIYPYIAIVVLVVGSIIRFDREPYTWRTGSSQLLRRKQLVLGSILFHIGILMIFGGHVVGLLTPVAVWDSLYVAHEFKQKLAIVAGGFAGILMLIGGLLLLHRRLFDPRIRANSKFGDTAILIILLIQLALGLATITVSMGHLDGAEMIKFMTWAQGIFTFQPGVADGIAYVHWIFKAHIILGLTIMVFFPFTRLVHMLSAPIWYLNRRGWQLVRSKRILPLDRKSKAPPHLRGRP